MFIECEIIFKYVLGLSVSNSDDQELLSMTVKGIDYVACKFFSPDLVLVQKSLFTTPL